MKTNTYPEPQLELIKERRFLTKLVCEYNHFTLVIYRDGSKVNPKCNWRNDLMFNKFYKN